MVRERIWIRDGAELRSAEITPPTGWRGDSKCIVGPFSNEAAANNFSRAKRPQKRFHQRYFVRGDAWYLELTPLND